MVSYISTKNIPFYIRNNYIRKSSLVWFVMKKIKLSFVGPKIVPYLYGGIRICFRGFSKGREKTSYNRETASFMTHK